MLALNKFLDNEKENMRAALQEDLGRPALEFSVEWINSKNAVNYMLKNGKKLMKNQSVGSGTGLGYKIKNNFYNMLKYSYIIYEYIYIYKEVRIKVIFYPINCGFLTQLPNKLYRHPEPLGTVLIMGAWNYPFDLTLNPLAGAIGAGNTAIIKPSEVPEASAKMMLETLPKYLDKVI